MLILSRNSLRADEFERAAGLAKANPIP